MIKLTLHLALLLCLLGNAYAQTAEKGEDYWVYIKQVDEITSSDRIAGTSQKGDIVDVIPCSRLGKNEPSAIEKSKWLIVKMSNVTEEDKQAWLTPYTETTTVDGREVTTTLAYRLNKMDVTAYKTAQSIDSRTSFVTTAVAKTAISTTQKTATDIAVMEREAKLYDRLMPVRQLVKWGWEKILSNAWAANTTNTVITTGGGDYATLSLAEDGIDGTAYSAGETATINCSGTTADTTAVTYAGWDEDVSVIVSGDWTAGKYSTSQYRIERTPTYGQTILAIQIPKFTIKGVQIVNTGARNLDTETIQIDTGGADTITIDRCLVAGTGTGTPSSGQNGIARASDNAGNNTIITNCIVYGFYANIYIKYTSAAYYSIGNNTCIDAQYYNYIISSEASANGSLYNNIAYGGGGVTYVATPPSHDNNLSSDATSPDDAHDSKTLTFVDAGNKDYHLASTETDAIDQGTDLSGTSPYSSYINDVDNVARSGTWDIGADEYVSAESPSTPRRRIILISKNENNYTTSYNDDYTSCLGICPKREEEVFCS